MVPPRRRWLFAAGALAALLLAVCLLGVAHPRVLELCDDAFISMRVARNMAAGHGLVFNPGGPPSEAASSFLFTGALAGAHALGAPLIQAALALDLLFLLGVLGLLAVAVGRSVGAMGLWAPAALACLTVTHLNAVSGLETSLATLLLLAAAFAYLRHEEGRDRRWLIFASLLLALLSMTRPEGPIFFLALAAHRGWRRLRAGGGWGAAVGAEAAFWGPFAAVYLPYTLFRLAYFGQLLPNAYFAKDVFFPGPGAKLAQGALYLGTMALAEPLLLASLVAGAWAWRAEPGVSRRPLLLLMVATQCLFMVLSGGDWPHMFGFGRFLLPALPLCLWLLADAGALLWRRRRRGWAVGAAVALALVCQIDLVALSGLELRRHFHLASRDGRPALTRQALALGFARLQRYKSPGRWWLDTTSLAREDRYRATFDARTGLWLKKLYGVDTAIASIQAGQFAYWSEMPFFDMFGLATPGGHRLRDDGPGMMARLGADNVRLVAFYRWGNDMHNGGVVRSGALWRAGFGLRHVVREGTFRAFVIFQRGHQSDVDPIQALTVPLSHLPKLVGPDVHVELR